MILSEDVAAIEVILHRASHSLPMTLIEVVPTRMILWSILAASERFFRRRPLANSFRNQDLCAVWFESCPSQKFHRAQETQRFAVVRHSAERMHPTLCSL